MNEILLPFAGFTLAKPDPERDAPFAVEWFSPPHGETTQLLTGNPKSKLWTPTLARETATIQSFLDLEKSRKQLTWAIRYENKTIGAAWIELEKTKYLEAPAVHIMIGDPAFRGRGIGKVVLSAMIHFARETLQPPALYSRYVTFNAGSAHLLRSLGFTSDGAPYHDADGLEFQNVRLPLD